MGIKEAYIDQEKFERGDGKAWGLPKNSIISDAGRLIVENEPNITDETLNLLIETDWALIKDEDRNDILALSKKELALKVFYENSEIGLAHVAQCIKDDLNQPLGELIGRYSYERRIPYLQGAIYIKALTEVQKLFYYTYSPDAGYRRVVWTPVEAYIPPAVIAPPEKKKRRIRKKPLTSIPESPTFELYACPICSHPARLFRCGKNSRLWHVCCMDPQRECDNFAGLAPSKTEKQAAIAWNEYVKSVVDDPIWSKDAIMFEYADAADDDTTSAEASNAFVAEKAEKAENNAL